jgi:hypothetical protein
MRKYSDLLGQSMFTWILQELLDNFTKKTSESEVKDGKRS